MELDYIKSRLCYYDIRNPDCNLSEDELKEHNEMIDRNNKRKRITVRCCCDNCFYGRTVLAEYILKLLKR